MVENSDLNGGRNKAIKSFLIELSSKMLLPSLTGTLLGILVPKEGRAKNVYVAFFRVHSSDILIHYPKLLCILLTEESRVPINVYPVLHIIFTAVPLLMASHCLIPYI